MKAIKEDFSYKLCGINRIIEEKGSTFIAIREIAWGCDPDEEPDPDKIKIDIRKYFSTADGEKMNKGVSMLSRDGAHELAHILLEENFGDTERCISILRERPDFLEAVNNVYSEKKIHDTDGLIDPRKLFFE